jgi:hypothetical protein
MQGELAASSSPREASRSPAVASAVSWRSVALVGCGALLLAVGGALLVLPGPGVPLVLGGLAVLSPRVAWARRALEQVERRAGRGRRGARGSARSRRGPSYTA